MPDTDRMLPCPVCKEIMVHQHEGTVRVDACKEHGIWLDQTELLRITEQARDDSLATAWEDLFRSEIRPDADHSRALTCPVSGRTMKIEKYQGVHMDWSPGHGVWLDRGELTAILNNLRMDEAYMRGVALRLQDMHY